MIGVGWYTGDGTNLNPENMNFWWVAAGSMIGQIALPFLQNAISMIAMTWFAENERTLATGTSSLALVFGVLVSFVMVGWLYAGLDEDNAQAVMLIT